MKNIKDSLKFSKSLKTSIEKILDEKKATDIITINLTGKSDIADFMVIASGNSSRHITSLAENVIETLRRKGIKNISTEGISNSQWVVVDSPYVVVHIFQPEAREYYNLERMWADDFSMVKQFEGS